jgi:hypothetical protein
MSNYQTPQKDQPDDQKALSLAGENAPLLGTDPGGKSLANSSTHSTAASSTSSTYSNESLPFSRDDLAGAEGGSGA